MFSVVFQKWGQVISAPIFVSLRLACASSALGPMDRVRVAGKVHRRSPVWDGNDGGWPVPLDFGLRHQRMPWDETATPRGCPGKGVILC